MKAFFFSLYLLLLISFTSCDPTIEPPLVEGMKPIYGDLYSSEFIASEGPREIGELGKFISVGDVLFINEMLQGIHVVDNTNPTNPVFTHFFKIIGNREFTIENNTLYADNSKDLLVIDISDFNNIKYLSHIENQYNTELHGVFFRPPNYVGPFECINPDLGIVSDWELTTLTDPKCNAF